MPVDNVRLTHILEASLTCVHSFSKQRIYNNIIRDINSIRLFKDMLLFFSGKEIKGSIDSIICLTAGIIETISSADVDGAYIIYREGLKEAVIRLQNHSNQKIGKDAGNKRFKNRVYNYIYFIINFIEGHLL